MKRKYRHIVLVIVALIVYASLHAQIAMPDTVCVGTSRMYSVNDATVNSSYTWKIDGVTQTSLTNTLPVTWTTAGTFFITVQEHSATGCDGDIRSGYVYVEPAPLANAGNDMVLCFGTTVQMNGTGGVSYHWSPSVYLSNPNIANPVVNIPVAGVFTYYLDVEDAPGCAAVKRDTVSITVLPPVKVFAGNDTSIAFSQPLQLLATDVSGAGFITYTWTPTFGLNNSSIKNPIATLNADQNYKVTATTVDGCKADDDITIRVFRQAELWVPNAFTPDGNGKNDLLKVIPVGIKQLKYFSIYNRWGELVFTTSDASKGWDGKVKGALQGNFVFVWVAEGIDFNGRVIKRNGTVVLIQ